jgi:hypothetical protein
MNNSEQNNVLFVTGVRVAIDEEHGILIAGMLSAFVDNEQESSNSRPINFALTRQHAAFLRDRLDEFLKREV